MTEFPNIASSLAIDIEASAVFISMALGTMGVLLTGVLGWTRIRFFLTVLTCISSGILSFSIFEHQQALNGLIFFDRLTFFLHVFLLTATLLAIFLGDKQLPQQRVWAGADSDVLMLLATTGAMVMVSSANLIVLFLGFELLSVSVYVLAGLARGEKASAEAALKYFVLGAFSSAFFLYGMVLIYGATGTMNIVEIGARVGNGNLLLLMGLGLLLFGFGFKISLVPFHFWTPDVYQGSPVSIAAYMAVIVKTAAFASFLRVMSTGFGDLAPHWEGIIWTLSAVTMTVGNLLALRQKSIKRMLAYSSIAHAGYVLMGFLALGPTQSGGASTIFYLLTYALMTISSFGIVLLATADSDLQYENDDIQVLRGFGWQNPILGFCMTVAMLSLAGMPPLAGFIGKFYLFNSIIHRGFIGLAVIAVINSVISLYYYLGVLVVMYFTSTSVPEVLQANTDTNPEKSAFWPQSWGPRLAIVLATLATIYLGVFSQTYFHAAEVAARSLG